MASFVPPLLDPGNPDSVAKWAKDVADVVNGNLSLGEPISHDTALFPNGVKGNTLGSFVTHTITAKTGQYVYEHNLNVEPKGMTAPTDYTDPLNVMWQIVRFTNPGGLAPTGSGGYLDFHDGYAVTANSIELEWHVGGHNIGVAQPMILTVWFLPTTR